MNNREEFDYIFKDIEFIIRTHDGKIEINLKDTYFVITVELFNSIANDEVLRSMNDNNFYIPYLIGVIIPYVNKNNRYYIFREYDDYYRAVLMSKEGSTGSTIIKKNLKEYYYWDHTESNFELIDNL